MAEPATALDVLIAARLASAMVTMSDGYPSVIARSNGEAAQVALNALLAAGYEVRICSRCHGRGVRVPYCFLCEDSTGDHECPDQVPCSCAPGQRLREASQREVPYASVIETAGNASSGRDE